MLEKKPVNRPSAVEILQEPFIHQKLQVCAVQPDLAYLHLYLH